MFTRTLAASLALCACALPCQAAGPDAGSLLPRAAATRSPSTELALEIAPEAPNEPPNAQRRALHLDVAGFKITGNSVVQTPDIERLLAPLVRTHVSLAEIDDALLTVRALYQHQGYLLARAIVPAQRVQDGVVEIRIIEGHYGAVTLHNHSKLPDERARAFLAPLALNSVVQSGSLERSLLLLDDLPGVAVQAQLRPGPALGTTELAVDLQPQSPWGGSVGLDNQGNQYTGRSRLTLGLESRGAAGWGELWKLHASSAGAGFASANAGLRLPLGASGTHAEFNASRLRYRLGGDFAALNASGQARTWGLQLQHSLVRSRFFNLHAHTAGEWRAFDDRVLAAESVAHKRSQAWDFGFTMNRIGASGASSHVQWGLALGSLHLEGEAASADAQGRRTQGAYRKMHVQLAHVRPISERLTWRAQWRGQRGDHNLDSSEKLALGGPDAVRAWPQGEAMVDDGWVGSLELRWAVSARLGLSLFADAANGRADHTPLVDSVVTAQRRLQGQGLTLDWASEGQASTASIGLAWQSGDPAAATPSLHPETVRRDHRPRVWLQVQQRL